MNQSHRIALVVGLAACAIAPLPAAAQSATTIRTRQIIVAGDQNVEATSINNHGSIVASLYAGITEVPSGIRLDGDTVTTLPIPYENGGAPHPKVIDDEGNILGWAFGAGPADQRLYLSQNGVTNLAYNRILALDDNGHQFIIQPMGLVAGRRVFYTVIISLDDPTPTFYGVPPHFHQVPELNRFEHINSMNRSGIVAGVSFTFSGNQQVFAGSKGNFTTIGPQGAITTKGGYVNNPGEIAGSYTDSNRVQHGFTLYGGTYRTFDMPEAASSIGVTAINDAGRVVGVYTSQANGMQHAFLYNGTTVTSFGKYNGDDTVLVALNDKGEMLVDRQLYSAEPHFQSYRATCSGPAC